MAAAAAEPEIVCAVHRGFATGILEGLGGEVQLVNLVVYPPERAGCRLQVGRRPPAQ